MRQSPFPGSRGIDEAHQYSIDAVSEPLANMIEEAREKMETIEELSGHSNAQSLFVDKASDLYQQQLRAVLQMAVMSGMMCGVSISDEFHEQHREEEERAIQEAKEAVESLIARESITATKDQQRALVGAIVEARIDGYYTSLLGSTEYKRVLDFNAMVERGLRGASSDSYQTTGS